MNIHVPDRWMIIQIISKVGIHERVAGSWSGSYLYGQSWKISSGIESIKEVGDYYEMLQTSGSVYKCHKGSYGSNMTTEGVIASYKQDEERSGIKLDVFSEETAELYIQNKLK